MASVHWGKSAVSSTSSGPPQWALLLLTRSDSTSLTTGENPSPRTIS